MSVIHAIEKKYKKAHVVNVRSGDSVKVHQKIREGNKERVQVFEGLVIRTARPDSLSASITVRRIASGVGVEKTYLMHSPLVTKVEVVKRSKVRRNYLSYMRSRTGKSARLSAVDFDRDEVNKIPEPEQPKEEPASVPSAEKEVAADDKTDTPAEANPEKSAEDTADKKTAEQPVEKSAKTEKTDESSGKDKKEEPQDDSSKS